MLSHSTLCFGAREVINFLGRKLNGKFQGEVDSDLSSLVCRRFGGARIKHRVQQNWIKMYDKAGLVLRLDTVINNPGEFRVRKQVLRYWLAEHRMGRAAQGRGVSVSLPRGFVADQRLLPRCPGCGGRPHAAPSRRCNA